MCFCKAVLRRYLAGVDRLPGMVLLRIWSCTTCDIYSFGEALPMYFPY